MKGHRILLSLGLIVLAGCFGGGNDFTQNPAEVRRQITENTNQLAISITAEDVLEASSYIHADFVLEDAVAEKFEVGPFEGKGPQAFREFFDRVVAKYGDLELTISLHHIDVDDNSALAHVTVEFHGSNAPMFPLETINFVEEDDLTFEWNGNLFALISWTEDHVPPSHNQGGGHVF